MTLGGLVFAAWLPAQDLTAQIDLAPAAPTVNDATTYKLSGTWRDGCVPQSPKVSVSGNIVKIATANPEFICTQAMTPWTLTGTIGKLIAGQYQLTVTYSSPNIPSAMEIGRKAFAVTGTNPANERILPIVVNGSAGEPLLLYQTTFTLVNAGDQESHPSLQAYDGEGNPRGIFCSPLAPPLSSLAPRLSPGGLFHHSTSADLPFVNGWAQLRWEGPDSILATAEVTLVAASPEPCLLICNRPSSEVISTTQTTAVRPAQEFRFPITINRNRQTAVAVVNPSASATIDIQVSILDENGTEAKLGVPASFELTVPPLQRISSFVWELAVEQSALAVAPPVPEMLHGSVVMTSDGPMAVGAVNMLYPEGKFENVVVYSPPP
jgi:hypothetical protein